MRITVCDKCKKEIKNNDYEARISIKMWIPESKRWSNLHYVFCKECNHKMIKDWIQKYEK